MKNNNVMNRKLQMLLSAFSLLLPVCAICQESILLSDPGREPEVHGQIIRPEGPGAHPAVIILYGSSGWRPEYVTIAGDLASEGFVSLVLDYYASTPERDETTEMMELWPCWQDALRGAVQLLMDDPSTDNERIGLLGFSLGGFLAVSTANSIPEVKAVVEFFGGAIDEIDLESQVRDFPPLLILHGEKDESVPVSKAYELRDGVLAHGGEVEMQIYPGAPHGFNAPWIPFYNDSLANDSFQRSVDFFVRKLKN